MLRKSPAGQAVGYALRNWQALCRYVHSSHVLNIRGRSYRLRDLEESLRLQRPAGQPESRPATAAAGEAS